MLDDLPIFVAVAKTASFTAAARQFGLSTAAVSKIIARLEDGLSAPLFTRTTRAVALTDAGQTLLLHAEQVLAAGESLKSAMSRSQETPSGPLRIAMPVSLGSQGRGRYSLTRAVVAFAQKYTEIQLDACLSDEPTDLVRERTDVAVRIAPLVDSSHKVHIISACPMVLVASPAYLDAAGHRPTRISDLRTHKWLAYGNHDRPGSLKYLDPNGKPASLQLPPAFVTNNGDQLVTAALAGLGIALLPKLFITDDLASSRLIPVLPDLNIVPVRYLSLHFPAANSQNVKVRVFIDFMVEWFKSCTP